MKTSPNASMNHKHEWKDITAQKVCVCGSFATLTSINGEQLLLINDNRAAISTPNQQKE